MGKAQSGKPFLSISSRSARSASKCRHDCEASACSRDFRITALDRNTARHSVDACTVAVRRFSNPRTATSPMTAPSDKEPTTWPALHFTSASPRSKTIIESAVSPAWAMTSPGSNLTSQRLVHMWSITVLEKPAKTGLLFKMGSVTDRNHRFLLLTDSMLCCRREVNVSARGCPPLGSCKTAALIDEPFRRAQRTRLPSQARTLAEVLVATPSAPASPK
mmetsp:Transcript_11795/g.26725  ORF Transcript_11795/g.26725 Transcript_11795/m.26725 type:complete len:219 (+) Transcript_11795:722-1378(+)